MDTGYFNILQQTDTEDKEKASDNQKISEAFVELMNPLVIRLGLEPRTPTLKVLSLQGIQKPRLRSFFKCYQLSY